eukprot:8350513-Lingulodinium_polyedra.AAC.1
MAIGVQLVTGARLSLMGNSSISVFHDTANGLPSPPQDKLVQTIDRLFMDIPFEAEVLKQRLQYAAVE